eukprot:COSAG01_NODE_720_length_14070_cov_9.960633_7_plen_74_part_00
MAYLADLRELKAAGLLTDEEFTQFAARKIEGERGAVRRAGYSTTADGGGGAAAPPSREAWAMGGGSVSAVAAY